MLLEASFQLDARLSAWLKSAEIDPLEGALICSREIASGQPLRSRSRVNGVLVNKQQMESLRARLVEMTAQGQTSSWVRRPSSETGLMPSAELPC